MKNEQTWMSEPAEVPARSAEYTPPQIIRAEKLAEVTGQQKITGNDP